MPLVEDTSGHGLPPIPTPPSIHRPEFRGVAVDSSVVPEAALLTHITGSPYSVTYFRQVIGEDTGLAGVSAGNTAVHQSYNRIYDMVLMVTGELSFSQEEETKDVSYTGTALVYPFVIPNAGDMFIAELGNARHGVFEVTRSVRKSLYKQAVHEIDYKYVREAREPFVSELIQKTIQTFYYDKNFLEQGQNPLLFEEEYDLVQKLRRLYQTTVRRYFRTFFSREFSTILLGGQSATTYDPNFTAFLLSLFSVDEAPEIRYVRQLNTEHDPVIESPSIWTCFNERQDFVSQAYTKVGCTSALNFSINPSLESIRYSGIDRVVYPTEYSAPIDMLHTSQAKAVTSQLDSGSKSMRMGQGGEFQPIGLLDIEFLIEPGPLNGFSNPGTTEETPVSKVLYHPIDPDGHYVLSGWFYRNAPTDVAKQSQLEAELYNFLYNRQIDMNVVFRLANSIETMRPLDQFYLTPLILLLIRQRIFITV